MRIAAVVVLALGLLVACSGKDSVPSDVLPKEEMQKVVWDIIQAERFSVQFISRDSSKNVKDETFKLYEEIFRIHNISRDKFLKSYKFYLSRPDIAKVMFDSLSASASRKRSEVYLKQTADSVKLNVP